MTAIQDANGGTPLDPDQTAPATSSSAQTFHVGTRQSLLARVQADEVVHALKKEWPDYKFEIHAMKTTGDNNQRTALHKFNEKALWTQELEVFLQKGELDFIVHSLKDMPTQLPHDLELGCITKRKDKRDALVIKPSLADKYHSLSDLPVDSVIGTSSLRRIAQLKQHYPHLKFEDVRGTIGTRLAKLDNPESPYTAIVIAVVGLDRLGLSNRISAYLSKDNGGMLYCVGQGGLGIETRIGDTRTQELLSKIECSRSTREALAERSLMRTLEGGCSVPIGVETSWVSRQSNLTEGSGIGVKPAEDYSSVTGIATSAPENSDRALSADAQDELTDEMLLRAIVVSLDGQETAEVETRKYIRTREDAEQFGRDAARLLVEQGADKILERIELNRGIIKAQGDA